MKLLLRLSAAIDVVNAAIGRWMTWLILFCTLISAATATLRYGFDWGSNALLEAQWFLFGLVFLFCASWTLQTGGHVRIDILYSRFRPAVQAWIDILGGLLFLLPVCLLIMVDSWNFFLIVYQTGEASPNPGGLVWWPLKFAIPVAFGLISLQGISEIIKRIAALTGRLPMPESRRGH